jgi:hypothetical protein
MAATIRSVAGTSQEGNSPATNTVTKPAGTADLDWLVAILATDESTNEWLGFGSTGFVENMALRSTEVAARPKFQIATKFASSEPANYAFSVPIFMSSMIWIFAIQGVTSGSEQISATYGVGSSTSCTAPDVPYATHGITDPLLITSHAAITEGTNRTLSTPAGMTQQIATIMDAEWMMGRAFSLGLSGNVATGARTSTISATEPWRSLSLVLGSAPGPTYKKGLFIPT